MYIFLGPTLSLSEARNILPDATYLPPVQCGDLLRVVTQQPKVIAIIDGTFEQNAAVWHKEILYCLKQGVAVYGASSMGALRAAECNVFGMKGMGEVYEYYRQGMDTDDDEVALIHSPSPDYIALSEPLVNIRATLQQALDMNIIDKALHDVFIKQAKETYYPDRSFAMFSSAPLQDWLAAGHAVDVKKQDAIQLLTHLRDHTGEHSLPSFEFNQSIYFRLLKQSLTHQPSLLDFIPLLNQSAAPQTAREFSEAYIADFSRRFRKQRALHEKSVFVNWLSDHQLSIDDYEQLIRFYLAYYYQSLDA